MKILIVRHGDPDYKNDSLTDRGRIEAELLSEKLIKEDIKAAYVSPLGRAALTADYTLKKIGLEPTVCPWLREFAPRIDRPDVSEKKEIVWDWLPETWTEIDKFYSKDEWYTEPRMTAGEVEKEYRWVTENLDALLASHGYVREKGIYRAESPNRDTIAFFCHFGVECVLLSHLLGISPMVLWHGFCALPSSVTTLYTEERREGRASFRVTGFGDTSHLYVKGVEPSFAARFCETYGDPTQRHD